MMLRPFGMAEPSASFGIAQINPALSARLREVADFLAAPAVGRLTDEQRATVLGIARRLIGDIAEQLGTHIDWQSLWENWSRDGIPGAERLALLCFSRAEEHRWRQYSLHLANQLQRETPPIDDGRADDGDASATMPEPADEQGSPLDLAHLGLLIADRRRMDILGNPRVPIADLDGLLYQSLLLDIAAVALVQSGNDPTMARQLGADIRRLVAQSPDNGGIDTAAAQYFSAIQTAEAGHKVIAGAIRGHDWVSVIAVAAGHHAMRYEAMALRLLSAEVDELRAIFAPLGLDDAELGPLVASIETVPNRHIASEGQSVGGPFHEVYSTLLQSRAAALSSTSSTDEDAP